MNPKPFFVFLFFLLVIIIFAGATIGDANLTGGAGPAASSGSQSSGANAQNNLVAGASASRCGSSYTVISGDTLSRIAQSCGVTLQDILAMNPAITNANFIRVGQNIALPVTPASMPTRTLSPAPIPTGTQAAAARSVYQPGAPVTVNISGFPPDADVEIGVGKVGSTPTPVSQTKTDKKGVVLLAVQVPKNAKANEQWTVFITTLGQPKIVMTAVPFVIGK